MAKEFFLTHFTSFHSNSFVLDFEALGVLKLNQEKINILNQPFTRKELHSMIFKQYLEKALGLDGFIVQFYQHF